MSANGKQRQTALRQIIRKISLIHRKRTEIKLEPPKKANAEDSKSRPDWRSAKAELHPATALNGLQEAEQGDHDRPDTQSIHSARSTDSRCSNQSCQSTTSRRSISSFKSIKSCLSRLSTASRSSQFSYENPVLEAVETMLDLVAKEIETRSSKSTTHVLFGNRGKIPSRYISTLKELEVKLLDYTRHPMILSINVHTAPPDLVLHCDILRRKFQEVKYNADLFDIYENLWCRTLDDAHCALDNWFEQFSKDEKKDEALRKDPWIPVPSPLRFELLPICGNPEPEWRVLE